MSTDSPAPPSTDETAPGEPLDFDSLAGTETTSGRRTDPQRAVIEPVGRYGHRVTLRGSEALREFIEENAPDNGPREYLPTREAEREKYEAVLEAANVDLIVNPRLCSDLAQRLGVAKNDLNAALAPLRRKGYVAQQNAAPGTAQQGRGTVYRVKPRSADPDVWKYREVMTA